MVISRKASPSRRPARLTGLLFAVVLAVLGVTSPAAPATLQPGQAPGTHASAVVSGSGTADDAPRLRAAPAPPPLLAGHPDTPLLPAAEQEQPARDGSVLPAPPSASAAHLAHRTPRNGRAPPSRTGI